MAWSPKAVANYFLSLAERDNRTLSPLKVQKLVYYAHGWHLALTGKPLINEQVEAWKFGPVISSLYHDLKHVGNGSVTQKFRSFKRMRGGERMQIVPTIGDLSDPTRETREILDRVWKLYGKFTAIQLSNIAHEAGSPWDKVFKEYGGNPPLHADIPEESIRTYFRSKAKA